MAKVSIRKIKSDVKKFKEILIKKGYTDAKTILFGSWAKGKAREESDIDVCVISSKFRGNMFGNLMKLNVWANEVNMQIETAPMKPEDMEDKYSTLVTEVKKYGIEI